MTHSPPEWAETATARFSNRITVTFTVGPRGMTCGWSPDRPDIPGIKLNKKEVKRYRVARDELIKRFAERIGGKVLVVESSS